MFISTSHIGKEELISCLSQADKIIVNSHFLKNHLINQTSCDAAKIIVNHLGVDTNQFQSKWSNDQINKKVNFIKQWNLGGKKILLFCWTFKKDKGHP